LPNFPLDADTGLLLTLYFAKESGDNRPGEIIAWILGVFTSLLASLNRRSPRGFLGETLSTVQDCLDRSHHLPISLSPVTGKIDDYRLMMALTVSSPKHF
jgi:hypothetical protein